MRFDQLTVGPAHDGAEIHLHPRLTVVGGMNAAERADFAQLVIGTLTGAGVDVAAARLLDRADVALNGSRERSGWRWVDDAGVPREGPLSVFGLDATTAQRLMLLSGLDLGDVREAAVEGEPAELSDARATLAAIDANLRDALAARARLDALRSEIAAIDERLRSADTDAARRRYATLVAELERVRVEAESIRGGSAVAADDRRFIDAATGIHALAERWRQTRHALRVERQRFGDRERLDARTLAEALATPDQVPPELDALAAICEAAEARRDLLTDRLNALAAGALPEPSHPAVVRLAHTDQDEVWAAARAAVDAGHRLEQQSLALGGLQAEGLAPLAASDLELAHDAVEVAAREMRQRMVPGLSGAGAGLVLALAGLAVAPLLAVVGLAVIIAAAVWAMAIPARQLRRRQAEEAAALESAGVVSYMAFQLRRLDVHIEPKATEPLELAAIEFRRALAAWRKLAGDIAADEALDLEAEARSYAAALAGSRDAADEIAHVREQLATDAEPSVAQARARLTEACAPFGIDDPELAVELVRHQANMSTLARLQAALEEAERGEAEARGDLEEQLAALGFSGATTAGAGPVPADGAELDRRLDAFEETRTAAEGRERARAAARPARDVEADLTRLEAQVAGGGPPEWAATVDLTDAAPVDVAALRSRRRQAGAEYEAAHRQLPDIDRLTDRRQAIERRVAVLAGGSSSLAGTADLEDVLLGRLAATRRVGPSAESLPVVLDDPFDSVHGDRKWAVLDAVERLAASTQLVYLTNDVDVLVWARRRSPSGGISLLEPSPEAVS